MSQRTLRHKEKMNLISIFDFLLLIPYLLVIYFIATQIKSKNIKKIPEYKYFLTGLTLKIAGVLCFIGVYLLYYNGGDTINYFLGAKSIVNLFFDSPSFGFQEVFGVGMGGKYYGWYNNTTGYPPTYMWKDSNTFIICRITSVICLLACKSFVVTSILTSCISYFGIWKLYRLFNILYPGNSKILAYLILFLPTLVFWGGGIMKDSFVLGATCWITYNFYYIFIVRKNKFKNTILFLINLLIIINVKAYVVSSLIPGMILWINSTYSNNIKNPVAKTLLFPFGVMILVIFGYFLFDYLSAFMGVYGNVDTALQQAVVIQEDLLRSQQYGNNNYNLGNLEGSVSGLISIAPIAVFTALFRPLLWEIGSPTMVLSAIENTILLIFIVFIFLRTSPFRLVKILFKEPFLLYCFVFSLIFALGVGIAGTNFGAMVRYKIPLVPFFFSSLYIIYKKSKF